MKKAALFLHNPECSLCSCEGIIKSLIPEYHIEIFSEINCDRKTIRGKDLIIFPGGIGDADSYDKFFSVESIKAVQSFVKRGGKYLGICMGAYWAGKHYFNLLKHVDTEQYIKRRRSEIRRSYGTVAKVKWLEEEVNMYFYDGCALVGDNTKFDTIATYFNKDPMAIIQNNIGLIGCHPESLKYWYNPNYLKKYWHKGYHHKLLLNFTNQLLGDK
jgi:glutamine amidotransferase-like uncharacterized protein